MPIAVVFPVNRSTRIAIAVNCTQVPMFDASNPVKKSLAFRLPLTDRNVDPITAHPAATPRPNP